LRKPISQLKTTLYRQPRDELQRMIRWGPEAYFRIDAWKREMEAAAWKLKAPPKMTKASAKPIKIWFLTGGNHWYQTAFCIWTFLRHSRHDIRPVILDDGTLRDEHIAKLKDVAPHLIAESKQSSDERFESIFLKKKFPELHQWRERQLLFRKLVDVHGDASEWRTFFDSDMLFWSIPNQLDDYLSMPERPIYQIDCWESYGYSRKLTESLCGNRLPNAANIGLFALKGDLIDWEKVNHWLGAMRNAEGTRYNVTQCTCAMIMAGSRCEALDKESYKVLATSPARTHGSRILEHYVSDSKPHYFRTAWRKATGFQENSHRSEKDTS